MKRWLVAIGCAVSLGVAVLAVVYWIGGWSRILLPIGWPEKELTSAQPIVGVTERTAYIGVMVPGSDAPATWRSWAGFGYMHVEVVGSRSGGGQSVGVARSLVVPLWFVALCALIWPALMFTFMLRRRGRKTAGLCASCGYDLRASPERCPECGRAVA